MSNVTLLLLEMLFTVERHIKELKKKGVVVGCRKDKKLRVGELRCMLTVVVSLKPTLFNYLISAGSFLTQELTQNQFWYCLTFIKDHCYGNI